MATVTITNGDQVTKDPADTRVFLVDWDANNLASGVMIAGAPVWTITPISPSTIDTGLTKDSEGVLTAAEATTALKRTVTLDNRVTRVRLAAGTTGQIYEIANKITTNETPSQTKEKSFRVLIENQ